jgi:signal transduction histidine kinase
VFTSLRPRLTFSYLAVIVLAMGLSGLLLLTSLERYFLQAMEDNLAAQARITAQALIPGAQSLGPAAAAQASAYNTLQQQGLTNNLSLQAQNVAPPQSQSLGEFDLTYLSDASLQLSSQLNTRIRILDAHGTVLVDSQGAERGAGLAADPLVARALQGQYASRTGSEGPQSVPAMAVALPVQLDGSLAGVVYLSQPLRDVTAVLHDLRTRWLLSTAIALALSGVVGLLLSGAIARPLRRLTAAAGAVAHGRLDQQVPVRSRDELGRLSQAFNDMTARLQSARQMQTDFVANVSHELRTPLTAVKGLVETLRQGAVDDPQVRDRFLETMETETDRLIRLVQDLLLLSRADSAALNLECEQLDLAQLAQATAGRLAPQAEARGLVLRVEAAPNCPPAWADPDRIEQVLVNLLDNALKYSHPGGTVTVRVSAGPVAPAEPQSDRSVQVQVLDEGVGIPLEELDRIGRRFYRADKARSRSEGGSGLGLAIARALVEAHGGRLWLESRESHGTVATFTLPSSPSPCQN